jgi:hypothetical protein
MWFGDSAVVVEMDGLQWIHRGCPAHPKDSLDSHCVCKVKTNATTALSVFGQLLLRPRGADGMVLLDFVVHESGYTEVSGVPLARSSVGTYPVDISAFSRPLVVDPPNLRKLFVAARALIPASAGNPFQRVSDGSRYKVRSWPAYVVQRELGRRARVIDVGWIPVDEKKVCLCGRFATPVGDVVSLDVLSMESPGHCVSLYDAELVNRVILDCDTGSSGSIANTGFSVTAAGVVLDGFIRLLSDRSCDSDLSRFRWLLDGVSADSRCRVLVDLVRLGGLYRTVSLSANAANFSDSFWELASGGELSVVDHGGVVHSVPLTGGGTARSYVFRWPLPALFGGVFRDNRSGLCWGLTRSMRSMVYGSPMGVLSIFDRDGELIPVFAASGLFFVGHSGSTKG